MTRKTEILGVSAAQLGQIVSTNGAEPSLENWDIFWNEESTDYANLFQAASQIRTSDIPVAFPTETVYGLGADATRSSAVKGIYEAKQRPSDNPLIVHFASLAQIHGILRGSGSENVSIPPIYEPLIKRFWPGPLTILLPNPKDSRLAPEVTAGLDTFGARIPRNILALALIKLCKTPVAAPSANSSTKPSPTTAEHVLEDLDSRIETILDGGPCSIGVESTVVNGLSDPPSILRPGGISMQQLRECPGWENVIIEYKDSSDSSSKPKAPGMKYRHYSPRAPIFLYEFGSTKPSLEELVEREDDSELPLGAIGIVRTRLWYIVYANGLNEADATKSKSYETSSSHPSNKLPKESSVNGTPTSRSAFIELLETESKEDQFTVNERHIERKMSKSTKVWEVSLGPDTDSIARGLFSALRYLDSKRVDRIFIEGIDPEENGLADAIMNRLGKAASVKIGRT